MIPNFPTFKPLEITDREEIIKYTSKFLPYSDFNFTSMWSWDTENKFKISILNENLVVQFADYISGEPFFSMIGSNDLNETISHLISFAEIKGMSSTIKLLPEQVASELDPRRFSVEEDRDNFDYVYSVPDLSELKGSLFADVRNQKHRTEQRHDGVKLSFLDLSNSDHLNAMRALFNEWTINKKEETESEKEGNAINRLIELSQSTQNKLSAIGVFDGDHLIAFGANEILGGGYAISHFVKANISYAGIYAFLMHAIAKSLSFQDCQYLNYEQDLGLENLRYAKMGFRPVEFLKKFQIKRGI